jgi:S-adenosylmethionine decarboxylase
MRSNPRPLSATDDPASGPTRVALGAQWLVDLHECDRAPLDDLAGLEAAMNEAARAAGATVIGSHFHRFEPQGISGVVLIAESHLTVHSWPEHRYAAIDLFSCSEAIRVEPAVEVLRRRLGAREIRLSPRLARGRHCDPGPQPPSTLSWAEQGRREGARGLSVLVDLLYPDTSGPSASRVADLLAVLAAEAPQDGGGFPAGQLLWRQAGGHLLVDVHLDLSPDRAGLEPARVGAIVQSALGGGLHELRALLRGRG